MQEYVLEVLLSDFSRLESGTSTSEAMEAAEYKNFMFESEQGQALHQMAIKHEFEKTQASRLAHRGALAPGGQSRTHDPDPARDLRSAGHARGHPGRLVASRP